MENLTGEELRIAALLFLAPLYVITGFYVKGNQHESTFLLDWLVGHISIIVGIGMCWTAFNKIMG